MKKLQKILLLAVCAGSCFIGLAIITALWSIAVNSRVVDIWSLRGLKELFSMFMLGTVICLVFGTPFLFLIEKYFNRFRIRYALGGAIAAWVAWLVISGPLFTPRLWLHPELWDWLFSMAFAVTGFATGALFTLLLSVFGHCKKRRERP